MNNIKTIVLHSPVQSVVSYRNESEFRKIIKSLDIDYYDFSHLKILNDSLDFYDSMHLNQSGTERYNNFLLKKVFNGNLN